MIENMDYHLSSAILQDLEATPVRPTVQLEIEHSSCDQHPGNLQHEYFDVRRDALCT